MFIKRLFILFFLLTYITCQDTRKFSALIIPCSVDSELDVWFKVPIGQTPFIPAIKDVVKEQFFSIIILFEGFSTDKSGKTNITFNIRRFNPDGMLGFEKTNLVGYNNNVVSKNIFLLSKTTLKIAFEANNAWGEYTFQIQAIDHISKEKIIKNIKIDLIKWKTKKEITQKEYEKFSLEYHKNPNPNLAVQAYLKHASLFQEEQHINFSTISFFYNIFKRNRYLIKYLIQDVQNEDSSAKLKVALMLSLLDDDAKIIKTILKDEKALQGLVSYVKNELFNPIITPKKLDIFWGDFFATSRFIPILELVKTLEYAKYNGAVKAYKNSAKTKDDYDRAIKDAIFQAAYWSIQSNCHQHELVRNYCLYILKKEKLPNLAQLYLAIIMEKIFPNYIKVNISKNGNTTIKILK